MFSADLFGRAACLVLDDDDCDAWRGELRPALISQRVKQSIELGCATVGAYAYCNVNHQVNCFKINGMLRDSLVRTRPKYRGAGAMQQGSSQL